MASGVGIEHYAGVIADRAREYRWTDGTDFVPHDAKIKEWGSGKTRIETMLEFGLHPQLVPLATIADGINAARRLLPVCVFHPRCEQGIAALGNMPASGTTTRRRSGPRLFTTGRRIRPTPFAIGAGATAKPHHSD
jgi:hypothetical protein